MRIYLFIPILAIIAFLTGCGGGGGGSSTSSTSPSTGSSQFKPGLLVGAYGNVTSPDLYGITQADGSITPTTLDAFMATVNSGQPATIIALIGSRLTQPQYGGSMTITKNAASSTYAVSITSQAGGKLDFTYVPGDPDNNNLFNTLSFNLPGPEFLFLDILDGLPH